MSPSISESALLQFLGRRSPEYHAKVFELRDEVGRWLAYTTASFVHYTAHTVEHSDEIIRQLSNLLFRTDANGTHPVIELSGVEAYILCASALLHDTGMVVSDADLRTLVESEAWATWLTEQSSAARRLSEINAMRNGLAPEDANVRNLIADRQMRYLVLDFARQSHHRRSAQFLRENQSALGRFAFDDPLLVRTVAAVCLAHGLDAQELEDREQFPEQRDIRGEKVNVRFCALLLRLGDLLDMSHDRACPLLLNAASPLPAESIAHWTQYHRITHRETDPDRIEISAECETQEEHRYLYDWCTWLVRELESARRIMSHATRHAQWNPPAALIAREGTIVIRPAPDASYVAVDWQFELDPEAVFERLIHDVNPEPAAFLRELLQNSFDASRCHLYERMATTGVTPPPYPNDAGSQWTDQFPIHVTRTTTQKFNELSQENEEREVIVVEDLGIGMDQETILRYLLQVGRSYYTSDEFLRRYTFTPTSRFGVGFLSVFDAAEEVRVETRRLGHASEDGIVLTLTGPRSYVLTERFNKPAVGTRVEVTLRRPLDGALAQLVADWCPRVEFPIVVADGPMPVEICHETAEKFSYEEPSALDENDTMGVRAFQVAADGVNGEIYVFFLRDDRGESWVSHSWASYTYPTLHPDARKPRVPGSLTCFHGISVLAGLHNHSDGITARVDYRRQLEGLSLNRNALSRFPGEQLGLDDPRLRPQFVDIIRGHLADCERASGPDGWLYKQRLSEVTGFDDFWIDEPGTVRLFVGGTPESRSLAEVMQLESIIVFRELPRGMLRDDKPIEPPDDTPGTWLWTPDVNRMGPGMRTRLFDGRAITAVEWLDAHRLLVTWTRQADPIRLKLGWGGQIADVASAARDVVSVRLHSVFNETYEHVLLNGDHELVRWIVKVSEAAEGKSPRVDAAQWDALSKLLATPVWHPGLETVKLQSFLSEWRGANIADMPPPETDWEGSTFL